MFTIDAFNGLYASLEEARARLRFDGQIEVAKVLSSGVGRVREHSDHGAAEGITEKVYALEADLPAVATVGKEVEISVSGAAWTRSRIEGMKTTAGVVALTLRNSNA